MLTVPLLNVAITLVEINHPELAELLLLEVITRPPAVAPVPQATQQAHAASLVPPPPVLARTGRRGRFPVLANKLRTYLFEHERASIQDIVSVLGARTASVSRILREELKAGRVHRIQPGVYQLRRQGFAAPKAVTAL